jgi:hypothetical protein
MFVLPSHSFRNPVACSTPQQLGHRLHPSLLQQPPWAIRPPRRPIRRGEGGSFKREGNPCVGFSRTVRKEESHRCSSGKPCKISSYKKPVLTHLESALTKSPSHKSRRISTYRNQREGGGPEFLRPPLLQSAGETVTHRHPGAALRCVNLAALFARAHS